MEVLSTAAGLVPSLAPAHLGSFEGGVVAALALVGARGEATFAFALALHATQVIPVALAGLPGAAGRRRDRGAARRYRIMRRVATEGTSMGPPPVTTVSTAKSM